MASRIITLTTDFGTRDPYVGEMKGVICGLAPRDCHVIDITHEIPPFDRIRAGFALLSILTSFPEETIHIAVVDPGVGSARRILLARYASRFVLFPDNGLITPMHRRHPIQGLFAVENSRLFRHPVSRTFHGRDIFAPVAAHLAKGLAPEAVGRPTDVLELSPDWPTPQVERDRALGCVILADRFGNLITNLHEEDLPRARGLQEGPFIAIEGRAIGALRSGYHEARPGEALALIGGSGFLEIAVNQGNAEERFHGPMAQIAVTLLPPP